MNFSLENVNVVLVVDDLGISCEIVIKWMSLDLTDNKSTLVRVNGLALSDTKPLLVSVLAQYHMPLVSESHKGF